MRWLRTTNAVFGLAGLVLLGLLVVAPAQAQKRTAKTKTVPKPQQSNQLAVLREEFIKATRDYKSSLSKLLAIYEVNVTKAEDRLKQTRVLQADGLLSKAEIEKSEANVAEAKEKVRLTKQQLESADAQIANTLLETEAEAKIAKAGKLAKGALLRTTSYIRYNGAGSWSLGDAWKVQRFFQDNFKRALPVAVFGQGAIHDRWRLDHRNSMDLQLHPDSAEGQALINFLRANGIPFLAFRQAIPGTATGPHIHVGRPSHRY